MTDSHSSFPIPSEGMIVTHLVISDDVPKTTHFYGEMLGGEVTMDMDGAFSAVKLANTWVLIVHGGGGTPDKPDVTLAPPSDLNLFHAFMNIRVADIDAVYADWSAKGVEFITPPLDNRGMEMRCYIRDPDGRIIEVGQSTGMNEYLAELNAAK